MLSLSFPPFLVYLLCAVVKVTVHRRKTISMENVQSDQPLDTCHIRPLKRTSISMVLWRVSYKHTLIFPFYYYSCMYSKGAYFRV
jgi:hypothetical protein